MTDLAGEVRKLATGIRGFDEISEGGLPAARTTLVAGTTGSGKTVFAAVFLAQGIREYGEAGVFVTFEEKPEDLRRNVASLGFDVAAWEAEGRWVFVDASPGDEERVVGGFDFTALVARIENAVRSVGATRIVLDSLDAVFARFRDAGLVRAELARVVDALRRLGTTAVITAERVQEYGSIARFGVEEFVTDNVIILRNVSENEKRRRTVEILKFRGAGHRSGEFSFTIVPSRGIEVMPVAFIGAGGEASETKESFGDPDVDSMLGGGIYRDAVTFVSGPSGTGKSLMAAVFVRAGVSIGGRSLLISFEEKREHLLRNAASCGVDLRALEKAGRLRIVTRYPEVASLEDHFVYLLTLIEEFRPERIALDNLSALERVSTSRGLRDFVVGLTAYLRANAIPSLFTATTATLLGTESITASHVSTLTDTIILLRYVEIGGAVHRAICVLKVRGSSHDSRIHEFTIDDRGMHVGEPFAGLTGVLAGVVTPWSEVSSTVDPPAGGNVQPRGSGESVG